MTNRRAYIRGAALGLVVLAFAPQQARAFDIKAVDDSVVRVQRALENQQTQQLRAFGHGTGFVIAPGYVVTNHHVVDTSKTPIPNGHTYRLLIPDGGWSREKLRAAQVIWTSKPLDLAVIRVPGLNRVPVTLAGIGPDDGPEKGSTVYAIGFPGASDRAMRGKGMLISTATKGVVGKVAQAQGPGGKLRPVIQHSAQINPGNSGGPLFNDCNQVVGINTFVATSVFKIVRDQKGETRAVGAAVAGHFYSPHATNIVGAVKAEPALARIPIRVAPGACVLATEGMPVWIYALIAVVGILALTAMGVAVFRKGGTREIVKVVESYSAWIRRKGNGAQDGGARDGGAGDAGAQGVSGATSATAAPAQAGPGWVLSGFDADGNVVRVQVADDELKRASEGPDKGLIVGRSKSQSSKIIGDSSVSRRHARLALSGGEMTIEDLGSAFGTTVDGEKLEPEKPRAVKVGAKVAFGQVSLELSKS